MALPLSVLLPVHNAETTLELSLRSLLRQRFDAFEVIAVDDGSEDATPGILKRYATRDRRIRPVFTARRGLVAALNTGLSHAEGGLLARMDADDVSHPDRFGFPIPIIPRHVPG